MLGGRMMAPLGTALPLVGVSSPLPHEEVLISPSKDEMYISRMAPVKRVAFEPPQLLSRPYVPHQSPPPLRQQQQQQQQQQHQQHRHHHHHPAQQQQQHQQQHQQQQQQLSPTLSARPIPPPASTPLDRSTEGDAAAAYLVPGVEAVYGRRDPPMSPSAATRQQGTGRPALDALKELLAQAGVPAAEIPTIEAQVTRLSAGAPAEPPQQQQAGPLGGRMSPAVEVQAAQPATPAMPQIASPSPLAVLAEEATAAVMDAVSAAASVVPEEEMQQQQQQLSPQSTRSGGRRAAQSAEPEGSRFSASPRASAVSPQASSGRAVPSLVPPAVPPVTREEVRAMVDAAVGVAVKREMDALERRLLLSQAALAESAAQGAMQAAAAAGAAAAAAAAPPPAPTPVAAAPTPQPAVRPTPLRAPPSDAAKIWSPRPCLDDEDDEEELLPVRPSVPGSVPPRSGGGGGGVAGDLRPPPAFQGSFGSVVGLPRSHSPVPASPQSPVMSPSSSGSKEVPSHYITCRWCAKSAPPEHQTLRCAYRPVMCRGCLKEFPAKEYLRHTEHCQDADQLPEVALV